MAASIKVYAVAAATGVAGNAEHRQPGRAANPLILSRVNEARFDLLL
jgi:hypothetical protein